MFHSRKWRVSVRPPQCCLTNGQESLMGASHARPLSKKEGNSPKCAINFRKGGKQLTNTYLKHDLMPLLKFAKFHWLHVSYQINVVNSANHHYIMIFIVPWCQSCWNLVYQSQISLLFSPQVIHKLPQYPVSWDYRSLRNWPCCCVLISLLAKIPLSFCYPGKILPLSQNCRNPFIFKVKGFLQFWVSEGKSLPKL